MNTAQQRKHLFYLDVALAISRHAKCLRGNFGAIIVKDDIIVSTGYNGPARGVPHCKTCPRSERGDESGIGYSDCIAVHAEMNAIIFGRGKDCKGGTLYLDTHNRTLEKDYKGKQVLLACDLCARLMIQAGIEWLVYRVDGKPAIKHLPTLVKTGIVK
jgi:dCMP deaminase